MKRRFFLLLLIAASVPGVAACNLVRASTIPTPAPPTNTPIVLPTRGTPTITPLPGVNITPTVDTCPPPPGWTPYVIEPGDSLSSLAEATFSTVAALQTANCLTNPDAIFVGQTIYLPIQPQVSG